MASPPPPPPLTVDALAENVTLFFKIFSDKCLKQRRHAAESFQTSMTMLAEEVAEVSGYAEDSTTLQDLARRSTRLFKMLPLASTFFGCSVRTTCDIVILLDVSHISIDDARDMQPKHVAVMIGGSNYTSSPAPPSTPDAVPATHVDEVPAVSRVDYVDSLWKNF